MLWMCSNVALNVVFVENVLFVSVMYSFGAENSIHNFFFLRVFARSSTVIP